MTPLRVSTSHATGPLCHVPARSKLIALVVFALAIVATPREWIGVFVLAAAFLVALIVSAHVRPRWMARGLVMEVPILVFALVLPFVATGPRIDVGGLSLSTAGLWGAWAMIAKATLGVLATLVLVATTEPRRIVLAFDHLGLPRQLTAIMSLMLRYLEVVAAEFERSRTARAARGFETRGPRSWRILAASVGSLFVRSYGRGERIHLAMLARGHREPGTS